MKKSSGKVSVTAAHAAAVWATVLAAVLVAGAAVSDLPQPVSDRRTAASGVRIRLGFMRFIGRTGGLHERAECSIADFPGRDRRQRAASILLAGLAEADVVRFLRGPYVAAPSADETHGSTLPSTGGQMRR